MALATLATGASYAALMSNRGAYATPLACPLDGAVVTGNDSVEGSGLCSVLDLTVQSGGTLDNNGSTLFVTSNGGGLTNSGVVNNNAVGSSQIGVLGRLENTATGIVNNNGLSMYAGGGTIDNAGQLNNYTTFFNTPSLGGSALVSNTGTLRNASGATLDNFSTIVNQSGGTVENNGVFNTGIANSDSQTAISEIRNHGTFNNSGALTHGDSAQTHAGTFDNYGALNNSGTLAVNRTRLTNRDGGILDNSGELTLDEGANGGTGTVLYNLGSVANRNGATINARRTIYNGNYLGTDNGQITNEIGSTLNIGRFRNNGGSILINEAGGSIVHLGGIVVNRAGATIDNAGHIDGSTAGLSGHLFNAGAIVNRSGGSIDAFSNYFGSVSGATFDNEGGASIDLTNAAQWNNFEGAAIFNAGSIAIAGSSAIRQGGDYTQTGGSTIVDGLLQQGTVDIQGGSLSGSGAVEALNGPVRVGSGATVAPGNSPGTMVINSDFECDACLIEIEIGGRNDGQFDFIDISGSANFLAGSRVLFSFIDGFAPLETDLFEFIEADGGFSGFGEIAFSFEGLADGFVFDVAQIVGKNQAPALALDAGNDGEATTTPVPEPAAGGLLGLGLAALGWLRRRNRLRATAA